MKNSQSGYIAYIVVALIAIALGAYFINSRDKGEDGVTTENLEVEDITVMEEQIMEDGVRTENGAMIEEEKVMKSDDKMMEDSKIDSKEVSMTTKGTYEVYNSEKIALADDGRVVLFFHASWCPFCRSAEADINKNISNIPEATHILKVDYDRETALKQKYGVTTQHTFVQVDKDGNLIKKWSGSETLSDIISNIK